MSGSVNNASPKGAPPPNWIQREMASVEDHNRFRNDGLVFKMVQSAYHGLPITAVAAGAAGVITRMVRIMGLDPKVAAIFTGASSILYYATKPLFTRCEEGSGPSLVSRGITLIMLAKVAAHKLKLNLPMDRQFAKACFVAALCIKSCDWVGDRMKRYWEGSRGPSNRTGNEDEGSGGD
jgi:hypothetical protein